MRTSSPRRSSFLEPLENLAGAKESDPASGNDAFLGGCLGGVHRILDSGLLLLHLGLGGSADLDQSHAADELRETLLELLAIVVGRRLFDLSPDLLDAALDVGLLPGASTMVVSSLVMMIFLALPRSCICRFSSLMPKR